MNRDNFATTSGSSVGFLGNSPTAAIRILNSNLAVSGGENLVRLKTENLNSGIYVVQVG